jgi:hypothetical protein
MNIVLLAAIVFFVVAASVFSVQNSPQRVKAVVWESVMVLGLGIIPFAISYGNFCLGAMCSICIGTYATRWLFMLASEWKQSRRRIGERFHQSLGVLVAISSVGLALGLVSRSLYPGWLSLKTADIGNICFDSSAIALFGSGIVILISVFIHLQFNETAN